MDWHLALSSVLTGVLGVLGWLFRNSLQRITDLEKEIVEIRLTYVHKNDMRDFKDELFARLDRIEDKLNGNH